jgi:hypothetical protein
MRRTYAQLIATIILDAQFDPPPKENAEPFVSLARLSLTGLYIFHKLGVSSYHHGLKEIRAVEVVLRVANRKGSR